MNYELLLHTYFGYDSFRGIQKDIIESIGSGHDTLGLMPTGGGKSITFQVPALAMEGVCIVISPLIALMEDQVRHLKERGINAEAIYSGLNGAEVQRILDNAIYGAVKFLYVSPERLSNKLFLAKLQYMNVCLITVDEAHCISQWGYDFRPPYLKINQLRHILEGVPVLALTATATKKVAQDIREKLEFGMHTPLKPQTFTMSFRRPNISYVVRRTEDKFAELMHIITSVEGTVIVYTRNRERTKTTAQQLCEAGITATFYHAGLDIAIKERRSSLWQQGETRVMVATNAFGMGIDKPDVRLVIHIDCPDSIEAYFQEAGRAGRDGKRSYAVMLCNSSDTATLLRRTETTFPKKEYIRRVYEQLAYFFELAAESGQGARYDFDEALFCQRFKHYPTHLESALAILQNAGYIAIEMDHDSRPRVMFRVTPRELYNLERITTAEKKMIDALLRNYGSLFTDLTYVDRNVIKRSSAMTDEEMHQTLKQLAQRRIVTYVPPKTIPTITYTRQRVRTQELRITKNVYEDLRERMKERIESMIRYINCHNECRERMMLEYFGEANAEDCGHCDVCLQ